MARYIAKRFLQIIPTLLLVLIFVFFFVRLIPGDPARMAAGEQATQEDVENVREQLGLNKPVLEQFGDYVVGLLHGDLGTSLRTKESVSYEIGLRYPNTLILAGVSILWSSVVGVLIGVWSARHRNKWEDYTGMTLAVSGISMPSFWVGFMLMMLFAVKMKWLPAIADVSFKGLLMPSFALGLGIAAIVARFTRSSMIEVMKEDHVRTARAKGASENRIIWKHVFRNAMVSVVTVVGLQFGFLLGGSVVVESVFAFPGIGRLLIDSVSYRDYPMIQALILIFSLTFIVINFIVDILYAVLNPEIQLD